MFLPVNHRSAVPYFEKFPLPIVVELKPISMETKEYFEKVLQDYNQHRNGRSLKKYCKEDGVDYDWLIEYKKNYPVRESAPSVESCSFIPVSLEENGRLTT